jgi:succinate dehydrogenase/fumarate reductase flavoprotein subunit
VFLDLRHVPRDLFKKSAPGRLEMIEKLGFDARRDLIEIFPSVHTTTGGVRIDSHCESRVHGLFAAGQVAFAVGDCLSEGATGIVDALVWGKRAGEFAATYIRDRKLPEPNAADVDEEVSRMRAPVEAPEGIPPVRIMRRLQRAMWEGASIIKNQEGLERTLGEIEEIRKSMLNNMCTRIKSGMFNYEMREAIEARHMLTASEMIVRSSLMRKESRNRFHRSDYPNQDDENWLRHILIERTPSGMKLITIPVEFPYVKPETVGQTST